MAQMRTKAPRRSIANTFSLVVRPDDFLFGDLKKTYTVARAMAPKGKLIFRPLMGIHEI